MTTIPARIKELDHQKLFIERQRMNLKAAGICMTIQVGPEGESLDLSFGILLDIDAILDQLLAGIAETRKWHIGQARKDLEELKALLEKEPDA